MTPLQNALSHLTFQKEFKVSGSDGKFFLTEGGKHVIDIFEQVELEKGGNAMHNKLSLFVFFFFWAVILYAANGFSDDFDFRKTKWGMSPENVLKSESLTPVLQKADMIIYETRVLQKDVRIVYLFNEKQLFRARYILNKDYMNKNRYIRDYKDFKGILTKKYGSPDEDTTYWFNDKYKNDPQNFGTAFSEGHLMYYSKWKTPSTMIENILGGENSKVNCLVAYTSRKLESLHKKQEKEKALDVF